MCFIDFLWVFLLKLKLKKQMKIILTFCMKTTTAYRDRDN